MLYFLYNNGVHRKNHAPDDTKRYVLNKIMEIIATILRTLPGVVIGLILFINPIPILNTNFNGVRSQLLKDILLQMQGLLSNVET